MKSIYKVLMSIALVAIFGLYQSSAYNLTERDLIVLEKVEKKIITLIDSREGVSPSNIINLLERSTQSEGYSERAIALLKDLSDRIDIHYIVSIYAVVDSFTPILYDVDFSAQFGGDDGSTLNFDDYGEIDAIEHIAPAGTVFNIHEYRGDIVRVTTEEYPFSHDRELFIHKAFISRKSVKKPGVEEKTRPSKEEILGNLASIEGVDYVWGGNAPEGVPELLHIFTPKGKISQTLKDQWMLKGVDCSGMIYWASGGTTPRNTSAIVNFGESVEIEGKSLEEIKKIVKPLDIIVWKGHMMVVYDENNTIESSYQYGDYVDGESFNGGVRIRDMEESLGEVLESRKPVNDYDDDKYRDDKRFVIKRWIKE